MIPQYCTCATIAVLDDGHLVITLEYGAGEVHARTPIARIAMARSDAAKLHRELGKAVACSPEHVRTRDRDANG